MTSRDVSAPSTRTVIIGAGPAGLTAAYELGKLGLPAIVLEQDDVVGGIARTVVYKGYRFDIGGHRFFTKVPLIQQLWQEMLGEEFLVRPRLSRIHYRDRFFDYPLKPMNALVGLGPIESVRILVSYMNARLFPGAEERNFEQWVTNRFGRRLFEIFFKTYTEKVWGIPCTSIGAEWAAQRIKNLDLLAALRNALLGSRRAGGTVITTLIDSFHYPRLGPGMMWERCREKVEGFGTPVTLGVRVDRIHHDGSRVRDVTVIHGDGRTERIAGAHFISTMPVKNLVEAMDPPAPTEVVAAARRLRYRDFITVALIVDNPEVFPDNWIYIHSAKVKVGRIQSFKSWSPDMVPDPTKSTLGLEYFVQEGDELWTASDAELGALATREVAILGLVDEKDVIDFAVVRMPKAYPVYDGEYKDALEEVRAWLACLPNLQLVGRNGQHRYNNQDHSMLTGVLAARNIAGADHDIWSVNVDEEYHEEVREKAAASGGRLVPELVMPGGVEELLSSAFARYDAVALGVAIGILTGLGLFLATAILLLEGGATPGPTLSLLGNYLGGYEVSWAGAFIGLVEAGLEGFCFGWLLGQGINLQVGWFEGSLLRDLEMRRAMNVAGREEA